MIITLDGQQYHLRSDTTVVRSPIEEWPDNIRLDGQQKRKDRRFLSAWVIDDWSKGLGREEMNVDNADDVKSLWDAENVDTRFQGQIVRSPALQTCTIVPSRGDLNLAFHFIDNLYFAETTATLEAGIAYQFSAPNTLGSYRKIVTTLTGECGSICGIRSFGGGIAVAAWGGSIASLAAAENIICIPGTLGGPLGLDNYGQCIPIGADPITRYAQFGDLGGTLHLMAYHEANGNRVGLWVGKGEPLVGSGDATLVGSLPTVIGSYLAPLVTDGITMFAQLPEGVYDFDDTPSIAISTERAKDKNCMQIMFQNYLYFKNKKSLIRYDGTDTLNKGYDAKDGLKGEKFGEITAMTSSWKWIFAAVKGATYSHILTMDKNDVWQYYARIPTAGLWVRELLLSDAPDAIDRLWVIFGNHSSPGYFYNPLVNPLQAGTYPYIATLGYFEPPRFDGGLAEIDAGFYNVAISGSYNSDNRATILYGADYAQPVSTLGLIFAADALTFGSPYGISGKNISLRIQLDNVNQVARSQIFRKAVVNYLKDPSKREAFNFEIDIEQSSLAESRPKEAVLGSLQYLANLKTLIPFHYGQIATKHVKVLNSPSDEDVQQQKIFEGQREGIIKMTLAEMI